MAYQFYVNMQKRADGVIYSDLHKTDGKIYFDQVDAERAILLDADIAEYRHVVPMVALTQDEYDVLMKRLL